MVTVRAGSCRCERGQPAPVSRKQLIWCAGYGRGARVWRAWGVRRGGAGGVDVAGGGVMRSYRDLGPDAVFADALM